MPVLLSIGSDYIRSAVVLLGVCAVLAFVAIPLVCYAGTETGWANRSVTSVRVHPPSSASSVSKTAAVILASRIEDYCGAKIVKSGKPDLNIYLSIKPGIGTEGYKIVDRPEGGISITGNDDRGLLYGVGKFLHTSTYGEGSITPSKWRGTSVPKCPVRGMYFATHFRNFYESAPIEDVKRYVEDLSLWGFNSYLLWFQTETYNGFDDPKAQAMVGRLRALLKTVKDLGMNTSLGCVANEGYANSPAELRADSSTVGKALYDTRNGPRIYNLGPELCPSKPGNMDIILASCQEKWEAFKDIGLDYWFFAPYDNGGCTCDQCSPWGSNGYLRTTEIESRAFKKVFPKGKLIMSLWYFDRWGIGEWKGISERFGKEKPWVDYVMVDDYGGKYPEYPLKHGSPGGLPMLNFPEISMYAHYPWGGYGTNPLPKYLQSLWDVTEGKLSGGFPYSEGFYEDVNKVMVSQLYWDPSKPTSQSLRDYVSFYFSPKVVDGVTCAMTVMEKNLKREREDKDGVTRFKISDPKGAKDAAWLIFDADKKLPERVRKSWRWRIVYLRAVIDNELVRNDFRVTQKCADAFKELTTIYHCENSWDMIKPPHSLQGVLPDR